MHLFDASGTVLNSKYTMPKGFLGLAGLIDGDADLLRVYDAVRFILKDRGLNLDLLTWYKPLILRKYSSMMKLRNEVLDHLDIFYGPKGFGNFVSKAIALSPRKRLQFSDVSRISRFYELARTLFSDQELHEQLSWPRFDPQSEILSERISFANLQPLDFGYLSKMNHADQGLFNLGSKFNNRQKKIAIDFIEWSLATLSLPDDTQIEAATGHSLASAMKIFSPLKSAREPELSLQELVYIFWASHYIERYH